MSDMNKTYSNTGSTWPAVVIADYLNPPAATALNTGTFQIVGTVKHVTMYANHPLIPTNGRALMTSGYCEISPVDPATVFSGGKTFFAMQAWVMVFMETQQDTNGVTVYANNWGKALADQAWGAVITDRTNVTLENKRGRAALKYDHTKSGGSGGGTVTSINLPGGVGASHPLLVPMLWTKTFELVGGGLTICDYLNDSKVAHVNYSDASGVTATAQAKYVFTAEMTGYIFPEIACFDDPTGVIPAPSQFRRKDQDKGRTATFWTTYEPLGSVAVYTNCTCASLASGGKGRYERHITSLGGGTWTLRTNVADEPGGFFDDSIAVWHQLVFAPSGTVTKVVKSTAGATLMTIKFTGGIVTVNDVQLQTDDGVAVTYSTSKVYSVVVCAWGTGVGVTLVDETQAVSHASRVRCVWSCLVPGVAFNKTNAGLVSGLLPTANQRVGPMQFGPAVFAGPHSYCWTDSSNPVVQGANNGLEAAFSMTDAEMCSSDGQWHGRIDNMGWRFGSYVRAGASGLTFDAAWECFYKHLKYVRGCVFLLIESGVNDENAGVSAATMRANKEALFALAKANDCLVWWGSALHAQFHGGAAVGLSAAYRADDLDLWNLNRDDKHFWFSDMGDTRDETYNFGSSDSIHSRRYSRFAYCVQYGAEPISKVWAAGTWSGRTFR